MTVPVAIEQLSVEQRLQLIEDIWVSLEKHHDKIPSPEWHGEVLRATEERIPKGEAKLTDWEEAKKTIRACCGSRVDRVIAQLQDLTEKERCEVNAYLQNWKTDAWDAQMQQDARSGKLDTLINDAELAYRRSEAEPMP